MKAAIPPWIQDQLAAASRQRDEAFARTNGVLRLKDADGSPFDDFATELGVKAIEAWLAAGTPACPHLRTIQPAFLALGTPDRLRCGPCYFRYLRREVAGTAEDMTCDSCGRECEGLNPVGIARGPVTVQGAVCDDCLPRPRLPGQPQ